MIGVENRIRETREYRIGWIEAKAEDAAEIQRLTNEMNWHRVLIGARLKADAPPTLWERLKDFEARHPVLASALVVGALTAATGLLGGWAYLAGWLS